MSGLRTKLAVLLAGLFALVVLSATAQARESQPEPQFTGLAASVLTHPEAVRGTDGRFHFAYEVVLTNATPFPVEVEQFDVRDGRTHRVLLSLAGEELSSRMNPIGGPPIGVTPAPPTTLLAPAGSAVVWLDVRVKKRSELPSDLEHLVVSSTRPVSGEPLQFSSLVGRVKVRDKKPLILSPPARGGIWVADEGCCDVDTHHRRGLLVVNGNEVVPQRFAIDWMRLDRQHRAWVGDPAKLSSYVSYGQPLRAVAAGTVVTSRDGFPDQTPPDNPIPPSAAELPGNRVILRIRPGVFVTYAHLKPGSVRVHVGERVKRGQLLGQLGNSGNSATPHLHLQVQVNEGFLSDGLPFVFNRFTLVGQITEHFSDETLGLRGNGELPFAPAAHAGIRRDEMPLSQNVVRFP
jgi:hypothetical protein